VLALGTAFLGVGDCGRRAERQFADRVAPADVLLVGHHGSSGASGRDFLEAVRPSVALIGVGRQNRYRHPGTAALERLDAIGAEVWRTDLSGTVHVDWREGRLDVFARPAGAPAVRSTTPWGPRPPSPDPPEAGNGGRTG
jgi:beta-lactamase superfamily II metal-dependent hydrolase